MERRGRMLECEGCGLSWLAAKTDEIVSRGVCLGHSTYRVTNNGASVIWGDKQLRRSHHAKWMRGILYCGHCGCHSLQGDSLRGLATQCRMTPASKYATDTRRMIVTAKVRQGVQQWPMTKTSQGMSSSSGTTCTQSQMGLSKKAIALTLDNPPAEPLQGHTLYPQEGAIGVRLTKKTNASLATKPAQPTNTPVKEKVMGFRLRYQQTGSTAKLQGPIKRPVGVASEETSLTQAVKEYVSPTVYPTTQCNPSPSGPAPS